MYYIYIYIIIYHILTRQANDPPDAVVQRLAVREAAVAALVGEHLTANFSTTVPYPKEGEGEREREIHTHTHTHTIS